MGGPKLQLVSPAGGHLRLVASSTSLLLLLLTSAQGARIFRSPEPHLPAENLSAPSSAQEQRQSDPAGESPSLHPDAASLPRSAAAADAEDYFMPGAWRPVRDPQMSSSGRRRISTLAATGFGGDAHVASARNLRHEDGEVKISSEARTSETSSSVNTPTSNLGHSIALVANQLLQSKSDILESRVPEVTVTGSLKDDGHWPHSSIDIRTPPKLMLQISGQKNAAQSGEESDKNIVPIQDDPMGENFFPSRRQPTTVTQPTPTTSGQFVTQMMVSTLKKNQTKYSAQQPPASTPVTNKTDRHPATAIASTSYTISNRKSSPTLATITRTTPMPPTSASTVYSSITPPQPPSSTSVKWKIAIPPNRQATRFPPRKPVTATTASPVSSSTESTRKDSKTASTGSLNPRPSVGGFTKPYAAVGSSRRPASTITRVMTTPKPSTATTPQATATVPSRSSFMPTSHPPTTTTVRQPARTTTPKPPLATTSHPTTPRPTTPRPTTHRPTTQRPTTSTPTKPTTMPSTTVTTPKKENPAAVQDKKPLLIEKEVMKQPAVTEVIKADNTIKGETTTVTPPSSTTRPRRPSNKRKKNKNRRRRPAKKPVATTQVPLTGTELEVKESPQEDNEGSIASPLSTRIYNFIAREVMPSMSVGLLGLVVTAGLAGYFLLPSLGLQRRSDVANGGHSSGGSYDFGIGGQNDDGGIMQTIFQNVMASVSNGEKEFERGPRRRRNAAMTNDAENEVDANLKVKEGVQSLHQANQAETTFTSISEFTASSSPEKPDSTSTIDSEKDPSTMLPDSPDQIQTTTEVSKTSQDAVTPAYGWEGTYEDYPLTLSGILRRIAEFKLRIGVSLLRATTDVIARYLQDVQQRLRDSDKQYWLRNLESTIHRIRRNIDLHLNEDKENDSNQHPRTRFSRHRRSKRHG